MGWKTWSSAGLVWAGDAVLHFIHDVTSRFKVQYPLLAVSGWRPVILNTPTALICDERESSHSMAMLPKMGEKPIPGTIPTWCKF